MSTLLHVETSDYGTYRIVDTVYNRRPARILYGADSSPQSGMALDDNPELLFDYNQRFLEMIMSQQPRRILVIGGGTCTLPVGIYKLFPDVTVDIVEIDAVLIAIAYNFFDLPKSERLQVVVDDAARFLSKTDQRYDMIVIDAFSGYVIPPHLLQRSIILRYLEHLTDHGVVAINFISEYKEGKPSLAHEITAAFSEVFSHTAVYQSDPEYSRGEDQNLILAAGSSELHFDYLQSKAIGPA